MYSLAPSRLSLDTIWAGTDDGLIYLTHDGGKNWQDITPPGMTAWSKVAQLDASHFDDRTVYAAVNRLRLDDLKPHIYRTHDGGASWKEIVRGLPDGPVNTVREDPVRKGLLFAGTELAVYVSFNDGDDWRPLRLNMPATSIRDLVVHGEDIVVGTHGRSFWILDDISPLRELSAEIANGGAHLFAPRVTYRLPRNANTDTPLPPEEPAGKNPPDGAILYYYLPSAVASARIDIEDTTGRILARFESTDRPRPPDPELNVPLYWLRPFERPPAAAGMHRFVWDLHAAPKPDAKPEEPPISAIVHDTPVGLGEWAAPGVYTVKLTAGGRTYAQKLVVKADPR